MSNLLPVFGDFYGGTHLQHPNSRFFTTKGGTHDHVIGDVSQWTSLQDYRLVALLHSICSHIWDYVPNCQQIFQALETTKQLCTAPKMFQNSSLCLLNSWLENKLSRALSTRWFTLVIYCGEQYIIFYLCLFLQNIETYCQILTIFFSGE